MNFYFVIDEDMIAKYSMPVAVENANWYNWTIKHNTHCFYYIGVNEQAGDAVNAIMEYGNKGKKYALCKGYATTADILQQVSNGINQAGTCPMPVKVKEITWIQR